MHELKACIFVCLIGSHCLVQWDERGNPRNVVPIKNVKSDTVEVGATYNVEFVVRPNKRSLFAAKILGIGENSNPTITNT